MKKTDLIIALTLGLLASTVAIWLAQPKWYTDLAAEIREWREPRRPSMSRYAERDRMLREEEREQNEQRERDADRGTDASNRSDVSARSITFAVVDSATKEPVTAFRYRRYFEAKRPDDPPQDIPWNTVSNNLGTFELTAERSYEPIERPRDQTAAQTEIWKNVIEDEMRKRWAQSDTLEVKAEGYHPASVPLFDLIHTNTPSPSRQEIYLIRLDGFEALGRAQPNDVAHEPQGLKVLIGAQESTPMEQLRQLRIAAGNPSQSTKEEASLFGAITVVGKQPRGGLVRIHSARASTYQESQLSPEGTYEIRELSPGACVVTVHATGDGKNWREHRESITLTTNDATQFDYDFVDFGTLVGTVTGLAEGEAGGIFAIKGDYVLNNVTEDDLYDFGEICDGEARPNKEGIFTIRELEEGKYTIIAIAERHVIGEVSSFLYVTDTVEIKAGEEASIALSLN